MNKSAGINMQTFRAEENSAVDVLSRMLMLAVPRRQFILKVNYTFKQVLTGWFAVTQVKEARRTLKNPQVEKFDCTQHKLKFWCYCCGDEVEKHVTDDNMTVMYGGLIEHMAT